MLASVWSWLSCTTGAKLWWLPQFAALSKGQRVKVRGTCAIDLVLVYLNDTKLVAKP